MVNRLTVWLTNWLMRLQNCVKSILKHFCNIYQSLDFIGSAIRHLPVRIVRTKSQALQVVCTWSMFLWYRRHSLQHHDKIPKAETIIKIHFLHNPVDGPEVLLVLYQTGIQNGLDPSLECLLDARQRYFSQWGGCSCRYFLLRQGNRSLRRDMNGATALNGDILSDIIPLYMHQGAGFASYAVMLIPYCIHSLFL